jgi:transposase
VYLNIEGFLAASLLVFQDSCPSNQISTVLYISVANFENVNDRVTRGPEESKRDKLVTGCHCIQHRPPPATMPSQLSVEVRELIVHWQCAQNYDHTTIAVLAKCNISTVYHILTRFDKTGSPHALPQGHRPPELEQDDILYILALLEANPTLYLDEIQLRLKTAQHMEVSLATICHTLYRQGWSRKVVSRAAMERDKLLRSGWIYEHADIPKHCFMWLDEAGVSDCDHRREEGWAPVGVAPVRSEPFGRDLRLTMLPVLTEEGIIAMDILDGGVTKERFIQFLNEQVVCSTQPAQICAHLLQLVGAVAEPLQPR